MAEAENRGAGDEIFVLKSFTIERHLIKTYGIPQTTMSYVLVGTALLMFSLMIPYRLPLALLSITLILVGITHLRAGAMTPPMKLVYNVIKRAYRYDKMLREWLEYRPREDVYEVPLSKIVKGMTLDRELKRRHIGLADVYVAKLVKTARGVVVLGADTGSKANRVDSVYVYGRQVTLHFRGTVSEPGYYVVILVDKLTRKPIDRFVLKVF